MLADLRDAGPRPRKALSRGRKPESGNSQEGNEAQNGGRINRKKEKTQGRNRGNSKKFDSPEAKLPKRREKLAGPSERDVEHWKGEITAQMEAEGEEDSGCQKSSKKRGKEGFPLPGLKGREGKV